MVAAAFSSSVLHRALGGARLYAPHRASASVRAALRESVRDVVNGRVLRVALQSTANQTSFPDEAFAVLRWLEGSLALGRQTLTGKDVGEAAATLSLLHPADLDTRPPRGFQLLWVEPQGHAAANGLVHLESAWPYAFAKPLLWRVYFLLVAFDGERFDLCAVPIWMHADPGTVIAT